MAEEPCECIGRYPEEFATEIPVFDPTGRSNDARVMVIDTVGTRDWGLSENAPCKIEGLLAVPPPLGLSGTTCENCGRVFNVSLQ